MENDKLAIKKDLPVVTLKQLETFQKSLQSEPKKDDIKINKFANNSKFVPIGIIEKTLDEIFGGVWQTRNYEYKVVVNELVGSLELWVYHPLLHEWIVRTGTGAVPITLKSGSKVTDIEAKQINACVTVAPHLKAECLKNAAKSFGAMFGRNLNRKNDDYISYQTLSERVIPEDEMAQAEINVASCRTVEEVNKLYKAQKVEYTRDFAYRDIFMKRIKELQYENKD